VKVIEGRFREARGYLWHCFAVIRPGIEIPVFEQPTTFSGDLTGAPEGELKLVIEEGRRQLDRQASDLERHRTRAGTVVTVALVEIALLSNGARTSLRSGWPVTAAWSLSAVLVLFGLAGAVAVLTGRAVLGRSDTQVIASAPGPRLMEAAVSYAQDASLGEPTVAARLTVLRDAVLLLILGALMYAAAWPYKN